MKFVKTYENFDLVVFSGKFRYLINDLIEDKKLLTTKYKNDGFWIQEKDPRTNRHFDYQNKFFDAKFFHLNDTKMREIPLYKREKMGISFQYTFRHLHKETEYCTQLSTFLTNVMKKYSYFTKDNSYMANTLYTFYIKTTDTENILSEIKNDFQLYVDMNKYNM